MLTIEQLVQLRMLHKLWLDTFGFSNPVSLETPERIFQELNITPDFFHVISRGMFTDDNVAAGYVDGFVFGVWLGRVLNNANLPLED